MYICHIITGYNKEGTETLEKKQKKVSLYFNRKHSTFNPYLSFLLIGVFTQIIANHNHVIRKSTIYFKPTPSKT